MAEFSVARKKDRQWTMMIAQPSFVTTELVAETLAEGRVAQIMHVGPYAAEGPTVAALHAFIAANGWVPSGKHHEIYLDDPRRSAPERLRTVLRQPVRRP